MTKDLIIIALVIALIYLYYQNKKLKSETYPFSQLPTNSASTIYELDERSLSAFDKNEEDLVAEKDEAVRKKNEAEQEVLALNNRLKNKQQEVNRKEAEITRLKTEKSQSETALNEKIKELKKDLTSEKQQHKGSLERIAKLTEQKAAMAEENEALKKQLKQMPGDFPTESQTK